MAEIASAFVSIAPSMKGFGSRLSYGVAGEVNGAGKRIGSGFAKVFAAAAAVGVGAAVAGYLKGAVDQASDLEEAGTKIEAIFGKGASAVQDFAGKGAKALGQTRLEVLNASATFGTFGKAAGLSGQDLAKFSTDFTGLATDLASFNNTSPEQAVEAIGAALRGEAEPMRQYGVLLDDATLRQEALKLGLIETTSQALTPQQKVLAAQASIYKQTSDAQGDFERTSGGLANQQRILTASLTDLQGQIGSALLPVVTRFFTFLNDSGVPAIIAAGGSLRDILGPALAQVQGFFGGEGGSGILAGLQAFGVALKANFLPVLQQMAATFTGVVLPAVIAFATYVGTALVPVFKQVGQIIVTQVLPIVAKLATFFYGTLYPAVIALAASIAQNLKPVFDQAVKTIQGSVLPAASRLLAKFDEYLPTILKVVGVVATFIGKALELASKIAGVVLPVVIRFQGFMLGNLVSTVIRVADVLANVIGVLVRVGAAFLDGVKKVTEFQQAVARKVAEVISTVSAIPGKVSAALGDLGSYLYSKGQALIQGLIDGIMSKIGAIGSAMGSVGSKIKGFLPGSPVKEGPLRSWNYGGAGKRLMGFLTDGIKASEDGPAKATKAVVEKIRTALESEVDRTKSAIGELKSAFDSLSSSVAQAFRPDLFRSETAADFFSGAVANLKDLSALKGALKTLRGWGLSGQFLAQLFASGNMPLILSLASGGKSDARFAEVAFQQSTKIASQLGNSVADVTYGKKLDRQLDELRAIRKALESLPKGVGKEINGAASSGQRRRKGAA